ncbi:MAG TPA: Rid family hydrolase [Candidatus Acidoferrales bacterium]|nr:Rid family hydrolase [Candidatus Acidoferrales bacterium]
MTGNFSRTMAKALCAGLLILGLASLPAAQRSMAQQRAAKRYVTPAGALGQLPFSEAVVTGNTIYLAGHIGNDPSTGQAPADLDREMNLLFENFQKTLTESGIQWDDVVYTQVFCTDLSLYDRFNAVYSKQFHKNFPARAFIGVASLVRGAHFEMQGIAVRP